MKKFYALLLLSLFAHVASGQITVINLNTDGGFEAGTTFAANGWTVNNNSFTTRVWQIGTGQTGYTGNRCAFIGNTATTVGTTTAARTVHLYRSITIPSGATSITLTFKYKQAVVDPTWDYLKVYLNAAAPSSGAIPGTGLISGEIPGSTAYGSFTTVSITIPASYAGATNVLDFMFRADGVTPHCYGAIDDISLTYLCPGVAAIAGTATVCPTGTTTLTDATPSGAWTSANPSVATISSGGVVTGIAAGTALISYTTSSCLATKIVTVNGGPAAITGTTSFCQGTTSTLANVSVGGTWSSSNTSVATVGASTGVVTGVAAGTATITYSTGCGSPATQVVTINAAPAVVSGVSSVCLGTTTTYTNASGGGAWTSSNTSVATVVSGTGVLTPVAAGVATISYTLSGCSSTKTVTVSASPSAITITPGTSATLCLGSAATFTATSTAPSITLLDQNWNSGMTGAVGGAWTITNVAGVANSYWQIRTPPGYSGGVNGDGTAYMQAAPDATSSNTTTLFTSSSFSTVGYSSATLTYNQHFSTYSGDVTVAVEYSINGGSSWSNLVNQLGVAATTTTWTAGTPQITVALPGAALGQANVMIRWNYNSTWGFYWAVDNIKLVATAGVTYAWIGVSGATGLSCTSCANPSITPTATGANVYSVTATANGCSQTNGVTVSVNPVPAAITGTLSACISGSSSLSSATGGGVWTSSAPGVATVNSSGVVTAGGSAGVTTISYTASGCSATANFVVNGSPASSTGTMTVCTGATTTLSNPGGVGAWTSSNTSVATVGGTTGVVSGLAVGTTTISYSNGCGTPASSVVTVMQTPAAITGASISCVGETASLSSATTGGTWSSSTPSIGTVTTSTGVVTGIATGTTTITYTLGNGCTNATRTQSVNPSPSAVTITPGTTASVCLGSAATFTATATPPTRTLLDQNWNSGMTGSVGGAWTITNLAGVATSYWQIRTPPGYSGGITGDGTNYMQAAPDATSSNTNTLFTSPSFSTVGVSTVTLTYNQHYLSYSGDAVVAVEYSTNGGSTWTTLVNQLGISATASTTWSAGTPQVTISLPSDALGLANVMVRWNYNSTYGFYWTVDNIKVVGVPTLTYAWTGISGATGLSCTSCASPTITPAATGANVYSVTATSNGCSSTNGVTITVNPTPSAITGALNACAGSTSSLASATGSGAWSSSTPAVGTVNTSGVVTGIIAGTTTISYTVSGCSATAVFTVNAVPGTITGTDLFCSGLTSTLSNSGGIGAWTSSNTAAATIGATSGIVTGVAGGTSTISYTNGCGTPATTIVTINQTPAPITGASVACVGSTATLASATTGGTWSSSTPGVGTVGASNGVAGGVTSGTTTITYTLGNGCVNATRTQSVNPLPSAVTIIPGTTATICLGSAASFTASATTSASVALIDQNWNTGMTGATGGTWTITNIAGNADSYWQLRASPGWASAITGDGSQYMEAAGDALNGLTSTRVTTPSFSLSGIAAASLSFNQYFQTYSADATVAIEYSIDGGTSWTTMLSQLGTTTGATTWTVGTPNTTVSLPAATLGQSDVRLRWNYVTTYGWYWAIDNIKISGTPAVTYVWAGVSGADGLSCTSCANPSITPTPLGANVYSVTATANGCSTNSGVTVTTTQPAATVASGAGTFCGSATITASNGSDGTMYFQGTTSGGTSTATASASQVVTTTGTYYFRARSGIGCWGAEGSVSVVINPVPTAAPTNNGYICNGGTATLTANPSATASVFTWSGTGLSSATAENPTATPTSTSIYTLTVSDGSGNPGCSPTTQYTTTVSVNPTPAAAPTNNGYICNGGAVTLTANPSGGATAFTWAGSSLSSASAANPTATPTSTTTYSLTVSDGTSRPGCAPTTIYTTTVSVNPTPAAAPVNDGPICNGGTVNLTANPSGGATVFAWTGSSLSSGSAENPSATPTSNSVYSLTVSDGSTQPGCAPATVYTTSVTVNSTPTAAPANNGYICQGGTVTLTANPGGSSNTYAWSGPNLSSSAAQNPTATPTVTSTYSLVTTNGSAASGCTSTLYTTTVSVNATPAAAPTNDGPICNGGTVNLAANGSGGASSFTWSGSSLSSASVANPSATPTSTSVYSLTVSDGSSQPGCSPATVYTTSVAVNSTPTAAPTNNGYICVGGTVTLTANPGGGATVYAWSGPNLSSTTEQNPTATPTVTSTYSLTVTNGTSASGCTPSTIYTTVVSVNPTPVASPVNNGYICNGGTVNLTANPAGGATAFAWSGSSLSSASTENPTATPTATSVYSLTVSDGSSQPGCSPSTIYTTSVSVNPTPAAAPTNDGPICNGGTVNLAANPAGGASVFTWSGSSLSSTSVATPSATPSATSVYSLTVTDGSGRSGCSPSTVYTTSVTVNSTPTAAPTNNGYICIGGIATLTANPGGSANTYAWSGPNLSSSTAQNPTATPTVTSTYSLTVTNGTAASGCTPSTLYTTTVSVNPTPVASPANDGYICNGGTVNLTANPAGGATAFAWSGSSLSSASTENPTATPIATSVYSLTVSDGSSQPGCSPSTIYTTSVSVNPTPAAAPTNDGPICDGGTVNLVANPSGGASVFSWSGSSLSSTSVATPSATPTSTSVYSLVVTDGSGRSGCSPTTVYTTSVTVNSTPTAAPTNNGYICIGGAATLAANPGGSANSYAWSGPNLSSSTAQNPVATPTVTSTYSLTVTNGTSASGCTPSTLYTTTVSVNPTPVASPANDGYICNGGTVNLTANPAGGATVFAWAGSSLSSASAENPTATPTTTSVYSLTVSDGSSQPGCSPSTIFTTSVSVNPTPAAAPTNNGYICEGGTVTLDANPSGGASVYTWAGSSLSSTTAQNPTATPTSTTVYSLTVTDGSGRSGCSPSTLYTTTVSVNPTPVAAPTNNSPICVGGTVTLTANQSGGANTYVWSGSSLASASAANPTATPTVTSVYSLTVSDGSSQPGCSPATVYTTSVTVNPAPSLTSATNDGPICNGTTLNLSANGAANVTGFSWTGPVAITTATSANASVPAATTAATGIYTVTVNNATGSGCSITYTTSATVNALPTVASITPSTTNMCVGTPLTLAAGAVTGTGSPVYNWSGPNGYAATTTVSDAVLTPTTTAASGIYTLFVTYPGGGCNSTPVTSALVTVNNLPTVTSISVSPSALCAENPITLTGAGALGNGSLISYNWSGPNSYSSTTTTAVQVYTVPGVLAGGTYSLSVTYTGTGCTSNPVVSNVLTVNPLPIAYTITGGGFYCSGGTGVHIGLDGSEGGINYQLYNGSTAVGSPVAGTGSSIDFGLQTAGGTYTVSATNATTGCGKGMSGSTTVSVGAVPTVYTVTGGGGYCSGGTGVNIGLSNSNSSVSYQLYLDGVADGSLVLGTGAALDFGPKTTPGTYTIIANPSAACAITMSGSASVFINPLPTTYNVTGGGTYCTGGSGVHIGLDWSVNGINYSLYNGATLVSAVAGSNSGIDFGTQTTGGTYTVLATNATTGCVRNMSGSANVVVNTPPAVFNVTGSGSYCSTGSGLAVGLSGSATGVNYQLFSGATPASGIVAGTGSALDFGFHTAGTYSVLATDPATTCTSNMSGNAVITVNSAPVAYTVTGGGSYCAGAGGLHVGLNNSETGVSYQLYNGASAIGSLAGTNAALDFGIFTSDGIYSVIATNTTTSCSRNMTGTVSIVTNALPTAYNVTGGGNYCSGGTGVAIGLDFGATGVNYQLFNGASSVTTVAGGNSGLTFGLQTAAGSYTVLATNTTTGCTRNMTGSATVVVNPLPTAYTVTGGGNYCAGGTGVSVGLSSSESGVNYQLYNGASTVGSVIAGTSSALSFGSQTGVGTYTVLATNATTSCINSMSGNAIIGTNPLPTAFNVTGGGSYCTGGSGFNVGLSSSVAGTNYQLYRGSTAIGAPMSGTGTALDFGVQGIAGTYTVSATITSTGCSGGMSGNAIIVVNPLPTVFAVTGGGTACSGSGVTVGLAGSQSNVNYQLYNGASAAGSPIAGTGSAISFGTQSSAGTYTVVATDAATTCYSNMSGNATVVINPLPVAYTVTGGGSYCSGSGGVAVGLDNSATGINYQLYYGSAPVGAPVAGTGAAIGFGMQTSAGIYTVYATNGSTSCSNGMSGNATVSINPLPTVYTVTGGGSYCSGGAGVHVGLIASAASGINYQLYNNTTPVGSAVAGTGSALDFGAQMAAGTYSVLATNIATSCSAAMWGTVPVIVNPLPTAYNVTGGGSYCAGGAGIHVGLDYAGSGINYQLYNGSTPVGSPVAGGNTPIDFGAMIPGGTYTVQAISATTTCTSNMNGSAVVVVNPLPVAYSVTGGGTYCAGGAGLAVGLSNSEAGVNYQLYRGATSVGSPVAGVNGAISFGLQTVAGTYSVAAVNATTACANNMAGNTTIIVNPAPTVYNMTGGGGYCVGSTAPNVGLAGSATGINYQLYNGASTVGGLVAGTGSALDFGVQSAAGTYTVLATNASTSCQGAMSGNATVVINPLPVVYNVTGGGAYCIGGTGVNVGLNNSASGVNYQLYRGATAVGSPVAGTGSSVDFGLQTATGTYTVFATNPTTGCTQNMSGSASISTNPLPTAYAVLGSGSYCAGGAGLHVTLFNSTPFVNYQLYRGSTAIGAPMVGAGASLDFGAQTTAGVYSISATDAVTGCSNNMTGTATISINPLPAVYTVSGGGTICSGAAGQHIGLSNSASGISYQLYRGATTVGGGISGTGASLDFGVFTTAGTYTVRATDISTACSTAMAGTAVINVNALPTAFAVAGGGSYCSGGPGVNVSLAGSQAGAAYQLYNGASAAGTPVAGTGSSVDFGLQTASGTYSVLATITATGCANSMTGSTSVNINPLPVVYSMTGGGSYCNGGSGVDVGLGNSQGGVNYQLYFAGMPSGSPVSGTGSPLSFGLKTLAGTYSVVATDATTGCVNNMSGNATVSINPLPAAFAVTGGGSYCSGGSGVTITTAGSATGINYQLYNGSTAVGTPVAGTGSGLFFGSFTTAGTYTAVAVNPSTGCSGNMTGSATVVVNPSPAAYAVTGGGTYCAGGSGVNVGLANSTSGINYQLYNGVVSIGSPVAGTGLSLNFGLQSAGTYTVLATNTTTSCTSIMTGSATVSANPLPTAVSVTGGGNYCAGGTGVDVGLGGSASGVIYQLYRNGTAVGTPLSGTGSGLSFGLQTASGIYSVSATTVATGCSNNMTGTTTVSVNALPTAYTVAGGGSYCSGGTGFNVSLSGSASGVNYQLYRGSALVGSAVAGTGSAIDFGFQAAAGTYTVSAIDASTGCSANMAGSASIIVNAAPTAYAVTGGGGYCSGGSGVAIGLANSTSGISYQLYNGSTPIGTAVTGTGATLNFGMLTAAGTYSVRATNTSTTCTSDMNGTATIVVNTTPVAYAVTGGGSYCAGSTGLTVGLNNSSTGVNYQLYNGSTTASGLVAGTGLPISFGAQTAAGTYTVYAMSTTSGCNNSMSGSATIAVNPLPVAQTMTGGGAYCAGGSGISVGLGASSTGVNYQLYNGSTAVGSAVAGTGAALSFGSQTAAGVYTVAAIDATTSCSNNMSGSATVLISNLPAVYTVTGGGSYCNGGVGVAVGLGTSEPGVSYQLYNGATAIGSPVIGSGGALNFGLQTASGTYTVSATNGSTCSTGMSGLATVAINALPTAYNVTGGGAYCAGGAGVNVGLNFSATGVNYRLYRDGMVLGSPVAGTGGTLSFGAQTLDGTYTVVATNTSTGCVANMIGSANVSINALPVAYAVSGGGSYCAGGTGVTISLSHGDPGVDYTLYNATTSTLMNNVTGFDMPINFGLYSTPGTYTVLATDATTGCSRAMTGVASVAVNNLPIVANVTGGGNYCAGGTGVTLGLDNSQTGVTYQLYNGSSASGGVVTGTGSPLSFGARTAAGTYTVVATDMANGCAANMAGTATVGINPLPATYTVSGGGSYCSGGSGVNISLSNGDAGIDYALYNATTSILVNTISGSGTPINFGLYTTPGTYTMVATDAGTGCTRAMSGVATVAVNSLPIAYNVTGGGNYCAGGTGVDVMLNGSSVGTIYQLYNGAATIGSPMPGTGAALSFGPKAAAGTYSVLATTTSTGCTNAMSGNASVAIDPTPAVFAIAGGGSYCAGGNGIAIGLVSSATGISYQLYNGSVTAGSPLSGTGGTLTFGMMTAAGTYTVKATNSSTGCNADMIGVAAVSINPLPAAYTVSGGGSYCAGSGGVHINLSNSASGVSYQLYNGAVLSGVAVAGTGGVLNFGSRTASGVYTVLATDNTNGCTNAMSGSATINVNVLPAAYNVTGGGAYCSGSTGVNVGLANSASGITYQLYNGPLAVGAPVAGTGSGLNFGAQTTPGTYTIRATNSTTGCTANMVGNAIVSVNPLPAMYAVAGGGSFCDGGTGVTVTLSGSESGAAYQLYNGTTAVGGLVSGTGSSISFGMQTAAGTYTVLAVNPTATCGRTMAGSATVTVNSKPTVYTMTGGGSYCTGGIGVHIGLANSASDVYYQLYNGSTSAGITLTGTGSPLDFGLLTAAGNYTVKATNSTTGCVNSMLGASVVAINPLPVAYNVTGGGNICPGSSVNVGLSSSALNVTYQLFQGGIAMGSALSGTGAALNFGPQTVGGTYTVVATGVTSSCTNNMNGSATVTVLPAVLPAVSFTNDAPATLCPGTLVTFIATPVNGGTTPTYQWSVNGTPAATGSGYSYVPVNGDVVAVSLTSNATCAAPAVVTTSLTMTVSPAYLPVVNVSAIPGDTVCNNVDVTFTAAPTYGGTAPTYEWFRNGFSVAFGPTYNFTPLNGDNIYCRMTSNIACPLVPTVNSPSHVMSVLMPSVPVVAITATPGTTVAPGTTVTFNASVTGGGPTPTYQWLVNTIPVVGATNATYMSNTLANGDEVTCDVLSSGPCGGLASFNTIKMTVGQVAVAHVSASAIDVSVLPNPSNGSFTVKGAIGTDATEVTLEVTDMLGQSVYTGKAGVRNGNISERVQLAKSLANGMYMLNVKSASGNRVCHIVLEQ